jgi:hypothetical protein
VIAEKVPPQVIGLAGRGDEIDKRAQAVVIDTDTRVERPEAVAIGTDEDWEVCHAEEQEILTRDRSNNRTPPHKKIQGNTRTRNSLSAAEPSRQSSTEDGWYIPKRTVAKYYKEKQKKRTGKKWKVLEGGNKNHILNEYLAYYDNQFEELETTPGWCPLEEEHEESEICLISEIRDHTITTNEDRLLWKKMYTVEF